MIFSKEKSIIAYTVEKCQSCDMEKKRPFHDGDCLFHHGNKCNSCNGQMFIDRIFSEEV